MKSLEYFQWLKTKKITHGVLPNPSCDLDSIACCLALSYYYFRITQIPTHPIIPYINLNHRFEAYYLLKSKVNQPESLFFPLQNLETISLVDHNVLDYPIEYKKIGYIIDHHQDQNKYDLFEKKNIELVGSCATLLIELYQKQGIQDDFINDLLIAAVLLDTNNFDPILKGRWTDKDKQMISHLQENKNLDQVFKNLNALKCDVFRNLELTNSELLQKDQKIYQYNYGFVCYSSLNIDFKLLLERNIRQEIQLMTDYVLIVVLSCYESNDMTHKDIYLFSSNSILLNSAGNSLQKVQFMEEDNSMKHYKILDLKQSRKTIEPILANLK